MLTLFIKDLWDLWDLWLFTKMFIFGRRVINPGSRNKFTYFSLSTSWHDGAFCKMNFFFKHSRSWWGWGCWREELHTNRSTTLYYSVTRHPAADGDEDAGGRNYTPTDPPPFIIAWHVIPQLMVVGLVKALPALQRRLFAIFLVPNFYPRR